MKQSFSVLLIVLISCAMLTIAGCISNTRPLVENAAAGTTRNITDGFGREVTVPVSLQSVVCSGSGCLRYLVYLESQDLVVGVDDIEKKDQAIEGRPYALVYRDRFKSLPLIGEFRGKDDPEKIIGIGPGLIFKTSTTTTTAAANIADADALQEKTGISVVAFPYGSLRDG